MKNPNPRQVIDLLCMSLWDSNGDLICPLDRDHPLWPVWMSFNVERVEMGWRGPGERTTAQVAIGGGPVVNRPLDMPLGIIQRITVLAMPFAINPENKGVYHGWGLQLVTSEDDTIYIKSLGQNRRG